MLFLLAFFVTALCVVSMKTCRQHAYTASCQSVASCCLLGSWPYPHPKLNGMCVSTQQKSCAFESRVAGLNPCRCLPNFTAFPTLSWAIKKMGRRDDDCKGSCNTCWLWYMLPSGVLLLVPVYVFLCVLTLRFCSWKLPFSMGSSLKTAFNCLLNAQLLPFRSRETAAKTKGFRFPFSAFVSGKQIILMV